MEGNKSSSIVVDSLFRNVYGTPSNMFFGPADKDPFKGDITPPGIQKGVVGWICPVCGRGNSPFNNTCACIPLPPVQWTCQQTTMVKNDSGVQQHVVNGGTSVVSKQILNETAQPDTPT